MISKAASIREVSHLGNLLIYFQFWGLHTERNIWFIRCSSHRESILFVPVINPLKQPLNESNPKQVYSKVSLILFSGVYSKEFLGLLP